MNSEQTEEDAYNEMHYDLMTERDRLIEALRMSTDQTLEAQALVRKTIAMVHDARQRGVANAIIAFGVGGMIGVLLGAWFG